MASLDTDNMENPSTEKIETKSNVPFDSKTIPSADDTKELVTENVDDVNKLQNASDPVAKTKEQEISSSCSQSGNFNEDHDACEKNFNTGKLFIYSIFLFLAKFNSKRLHY